MQWNKSLRYTAVALAGAAICALPAAAQGYEIVVNNRTVDTGTQPPVYMNGHLLVPLAAIGDAMGAYLEWRPNTRTVFGQQGGHQFTLPVDSTSARVDGRTQYLSTPATIIHGHTMVPLRFVATALGADVRYEAPTQTVYVASVDTGTTTARVPGRFGRRRTDQYDRNNQYDTTPPVFRLAEPPAGTLVTDRNVRISAELRDPSGSGINPDTVRMWVNGVEVTQRADVRGNRVVYDGHFTPGPVRVRIVAEDNAGNRAQTVWTFRVRGRQAASVPAIWSPEPPARLSSLR